MGTFPSQSSYIFAAFFYWSLISYRLKLKWINERESPQDIAFDLCFIGKMHSIWMVYTLFLGVNWWQVRAPLGHYGDIIIGAIASQITSLTLVYSIVYSYADQRKNQSSTSLAFVRGIHRGPVNSPHKWPVTRKMFPFDDVIMQCHELAKVPASPCYDMYETYPLQNQCQQGVSNLSSDCMIAVLPANQRAGFQFIVYQNLLTWNFSCEKRAAGKPITLGMRCW